MLTGHLGAAEYEARIWADQSGKFEIRATFIDVVEGKVRLERPNGTISRVPLKKLSKADQDYVRDAGKDKPSEKPKKPVVQGLQVGDLIEADHFGKWRLAKVVEIDYKWERVDVHIEGEKKFAWPVSLKKLRYPETMQRPILVKPASPESSLKTIRPDYTDMDRLLADGKPADRVEADPLKPTEGAWKPRAVRLAAGGFVEQTHSFQTASDFAIATSPTPLAMIVYETQGMDEEPAHVELVDLTARKVVLQGPAPTGTEKLAMSSAGGSVATFRSGNYGPDSMGLVDFWKIADKKASHWISFAPYVMNTWPNLDPEWSAWLDDDRLFTVNGEGQLILWQVESAKALYELLLDGNVRPILSHRKKHLVVPTSSGIQFFDTQSGELQAVVGAGNYGNASLAFSPSGKQLAIASWGFIDVLDVTTGVTTRSFPCQGIHGTGAIAWVNEDYLFTENGLLIHVPLRLIAWKYEINSRLVKSFAGTHWALLASSSGKGQVLAPLELPPPEAEAAIENLDEKEILVVRPGDAIRIDVQIHNDTFLAQDVRRALIKALDDAGMKVTEDSDLKLIAKAKTGKTQKVNYRSFGTFRGQGETIEVTSRVYELELLRQGVVVWRRESTHSAPRHLQLNKGETIRAAIDRVLKPRAGNFHGRLPSYVVRPEYREPLGKSKLSL